MAINNLIKSVSYNQMEIIESILKLYVPKQKIDADITYSIGNFYKSGAIPQPEFKFDIDPQEDVAYADCRNLPLLDESVDCIMFDPPFLATTGQSLFSRTKNNIITKRFGCYDTEQALFEMYVDTLNETYRVLKNNGILIFKCQDKISSGKQYMSHVFIINQAEQIGYYCEDLFVLLSKNRLISGKHVNQKHARKFHSYFLVLKKCNKKIKYL